MEKTRTVGCVIAVAGILLAPGCGAPLDGTTGEISRELNWIDPNWTSGLAPDAIVGGYDNNGAPEYICRGSFYGSFQPGKTEAGWGVCDFGYGGREYTSAEYETLTPIWVPASNGSVPNYASAFGYEPPNITPLYPCRATVNGYVYLGQVRPGYNGCYIPYAGGELHVANYEVLVNTGVLEMFIQHGAPQANSIIGGFEPNGAAAYPCVGNYQNGNHPGFVDPAHPGLCNVSWNGTSVYLTDFDTLIARFGYPWGSSQVFPAGTDTNGNPLGVCSAPYVNGVQVGKYFSTGACNFGYGGSEVSVTSNYSILIGVTCVAGQACLGW
jgi:hypothetical protein